MFEVLYQVVRVGLVAAWFASAWIVWRRRVEWHRLAVYGAIAALLFASLRAWPWNFAVLSAWRAVLQELGVYERRIWLKLAIAAAFLVGSWFAWRHLRRIARRPAPFFCCVGLGLQATLLAIETLSLDEMLPDCLFEQPGRYLLEGAFAILVIASAWSGRSTGSNGSARRGPTEVA